MKRNESGAMLAFSLWYSTQGLGRIQSMPAFAAGVKKSLHPQPSIERIKHVKPPRQVARLDDIVPPTDL